MGIRIHPDSNTFRNLKSLVKANGIDGVIETLVMIVNCLPDPEEGSEADEIAQILRAYDRLKELRELRASCIVDLNEESVSAIECDERNTALWLSESPDEASELAELEKIVKWLLRMPNIHQTK